MKRFPLLALCLLIVSPVLAASKPLTPGVYTVQPCPALVKCPDATPCPDVSGVESRLDNLDADVKALDSTVTATNAAPRDCLQPVPGGGGFDGSAYRLGFAEPAAPVAHQARPWYKDKRFWIGTGIGIVVGAIADHQWGHDDDGTNTKKKTVHVTDPNQPDPDPDPCWPPGHCKP